MEEDSPSVQAMAAAQKHSRKRGSTVSQLLTPINPHVQQAFVECHSEGHQWRPVPGKVDPTEAEPGMRPPSWERLAVGRRSQCVSCGAERIRWYTRGGEVVNRYRYADGYLHKREYEDDVAPTRLEWRKRLVVTLFDDLELGAPTPPAAAPQRRPRKRAAS